MNTDRPARKRDAAATKEALLDAAARVFAERGFHRTTMRDVADLAGSNQALVFRYFGSKDGLFEEVMVRAQEARLATTPPQQLLEATLRDLLSPDRTGQRGRALQAFVRSLGTDDAAPATRQQLSERFTDALGTLTDAGNAPLRADIALSLVLGIALLRNVSHKQPLANADPDEVCALALDAARILLERSSP